jgi:formate hydrogenlyase subunit 3/multisubunit Na+/H+ antiporter MnhD subunit
MQGLAKFTVVPVIGWAFSALFAFLIAMPLHFLWSWLGPTYFAFVPAVYLNMGFWDMAGMLVLIGFIKLIVYPSAFNRTFTSTKEKSQ